MAKFSRHRPTGRREDAREWPTLVVATAAGLLMIGCLVGTVMAIRVYSAKSAIGPLSEWVPGAVTAVALSYSLMATRQQRRREYDRETRSDAERVAVWIELERDTVTGSNGRVLKFDTHHCALRWINSNEVPVYELTAELDISDGTQRTEFLGVIPPDTHNGYQQLANYRVQDGVAVGEASPFPVRAGCSFKDSAGRRWRRLHDGALIGPIREADFSEQWAPR